MTSRELKKIVADEMGCHQSDVDVNGLKGCLLMNIRNLSEVRFIRLADGHHQIEFFYNDGGSYDYTQYIIEDYIR